MPLVRRAQCAEDCRCVLCRELKDLKGREMSACGGGGVEVPRICDDGANFILRRAVPFPSKPSPAGRERRPEARRDDCYEKSPTLEERSRCCGSGDRKVGKDVGHKTVIYFGDTNPRRREERANWQPPPPPPLPPPPPPLSQAPLSPEAKQHAIAPRRSESLEKALLCTRNDDAQVRRDGSTGKKKDDDRGDASVVARNSASGNDPAKVAHEIVVNVSPSREDVLRIEEDESQLEDYWSLPGDRSGFKADWSFVQQWRLRG